MYKSNDGRGNHALSSQPVEIKACDSVWDRRDRLMAAKAERDAEKRATIDWLDGGRNIVYLK